MQIACWLHGTGIAVLLAGCSHVPAQHVAEPVAAQIAVIDRGWHTEIGLPAEFATGRLNEVAARFPGVRWLTIGFGDRAYLQSPQRGLPAMLKALMPGPGLLLVTAIRTAPEAAFGADNVVRLSVSRPGMQGLQRFLDVAFAAAPDGAPLLVGPGPYAGSQFYVAAATYSLAHTCNTWVAEALDAAGLDVAPDGLLFAGQLMHRVRQIAAAQARRPRLSQDGPVQHVP
jgi:uncharacterized protein (TIGR02117 family)